MQASLPRSLSTVPSLWPDRIKQTALTAGQLAIPTALASIAGALYEAPAWANVIPTAVCALGLVDTSSNLILGLYNRAGDRLKQLTGQANYAAMARVENRLKTHFFDSISPLWALPLASMAGGAFLAHALRANGVDLPMGLLTQTLGVGVLAGTGAVLFEKFAENFLAKTVK